MPNWCWNTVQFTGKQNNLENLNKLLHKTVEMQEKTGMGQILHGIEGSLDGYMFDISDVDLGDEYLSLTFQSRWAPIPNDIVRIAELFDLQFTYSYDEGGMALYGKYTFEIIDGEGNLYEQSVTEKQVSECTFMEDDDDEDCPSGFDYEKLEGFIESASMESCQVTRVNETVA
jgi:hypothetical protein